MMRSVLAFAWPRWTRVDGAEDRGKLSHAATSRPYVRRDAGP